MAGGFVPEDMNDDQLQHELSSVNDRLVLAIKHSDEWNILNEMKVELEDEVAYRKRQSAKGETYQPPVVGEFVFGVQEQSPLPSVPGSKEFEEEASGRPFPVVLDISIPGSVYDDCVNPNCSEFLRENIDFPEPEYVKRGRGVSIFFRGVTPDMVNSLYDHLDCYRVTRKDSDDPTDREMSYRIEEAMEKLLKEKYKAYS